MSLDPHSTLGQVDNFNNQLALYFSAMNKYVVDNTGSIPLPDISTYTDLLDYSELLRMTLSRVADAASFENGVAIENIHAMVSIIREFSLRSKNKVNYYSDAGSEYMNESNFYATMKTLYVSILTGTSGVGSNVTGI